MLLHKGESNKRKDQKLIGLAKIGKLDLLESLSEEVLIPPFVKKELFGKIGPEAEHIERAVDQFIHVKDALSV